MYHTLKLYSNDVAILKDYGGLKRKITIHKVLRNKGFELDNKNKRVKGSVNDEKLDCNISRTKAKIFELAYCNPWEYFCTLTLDPKKYDRTDLKQYNKDLNYFIKNYNKKYKLDIKRLLIPEQHKDGSWHMHGFLMGLPLKHLKYNSNGYLDWNAYKEKFGYISIDKIKDSEKVASYITKYITKNLGDCVKKVNAKMYYCSLGLKGAIEVKRGIIPGDIIPQYDYEGEWVKIKNFDSSVPLEALKNLII